MENKNNTQKPEVILKTKYHWSTFIFPVIFMLTGLFYAFSENFKLGVICFLIGLSIAISIYYLNFKDKTFILTSNKIYLMDKKKKLLTINLSHGELLGYSYSNTIFNKIFNTYNISFHLNIGNKKRVVTFYFVKNGKLFALYSFYQSEKYLEKLDPNYKKKLEKPKRGLISDIGAEGVDKI